MLKRPLRNKSGVKGVKGVKHKAERPKPKGK